MRSVQGEEGKWFWDKMVRKVGDGNETRFWEGVWLGDSSMKERFPRLFHLCENQMAKISEMGFYAQGEWRWRTRWRRELREREMEEVQEMCVMLQ